MPDTPTSAGFRAVVQRNVKLQDFNAKLQRTNKDLLEALKLVDSFTFEYAGDEEGALMHIQDIARAAITKAEGS